MGKKDRCAVFGCNNDRLFPEKYTVKFSFCPKSARKYNMAAVSVKRSIGSDDERQYNDNKNVRKEKP